MHIKNNSAYISLKCLNLHQTNLEEPCIKISIIFLKTNQNVLVF